jgi:hypothetical protein
MNGKKFREEMLKRKQQLLKCKIPQQLKRRMELLLMIAYLIAKVEPIRYLKSSKSCYPLESTST